MEIPGFAGGIRHDLSLEELANARQVLWRVFFFWRRDAFWGSFPYYKMISLIMNNDEVNRAS